MTSRRVRFCVEAGFVFLSNLFGVFCKIFKIIAPKESILRNILLSGATSRLDVSRASSERRLSASEFWRRLKSPPQVLYWSKS